MIILLIVFIQKKNSCSLYKIVQMKKYGYSFLSIAFLGVVITSCSFYHGKPSGVVAWNLSDPDAINPIIAITAQAQDINNNVFQPLMNFDYHTLKLVPVLADSLPIVLLDSSGHMNITFEIRKEAKWDNGSPITAKDVEFTLKVIKNTSVNDESLRSYYNMVSDIIMYPVNPRKFTVVYNEKYM